MRALLFLLLACSLCGTSALSAADEPPADDWLTNQAACLPLYPRNTPTQFVRLAGFDELHAQVVGSRYLSIVWPKPAPTNIGPAVLASADPLGHWPVRDWRLYPMSLDDGSWSVRVPVDSIKVPIVYFLRVDDAKATSISPMRICHPREAGMDAPSRLFWPFVEGFEHGTQGWRLVDKSSSAASLGTDSVAKSGYCSLKVSIPRGQHSATLASTRFRGWLIEEKEATGFRLWLRTKSGTGDALFTLHSDAFTTNQISSPCVSQVTISNQWQHADLFFEQFPALPVGDIDWLTIEFRGKGPIDFLLDDVQLLGPWILDPE